MADGDLYDDFLKYLGGDWGVDSGVSEFLDFESADYCVLESAD